MRKAFDVGEAGLELLQDFERAFGAMFSAQSFRNLLGGLVGTVNETNRLKSQHAVEDLSQKIYSASVNRDQSKNVGYFRRCNLTEKDESL